MVTVSVDTSALMLPVELDIRLFEELQRLLGDFDPIVSSSVLDELESLSAEGGQTGRAARVGLALAGEHCEPIETEQPVADDAVLALASDGLAGYLVTADRELATRARAAGITTITPRGRRQLAIEPP